MGFSVSVVADIFKFPWPLYPKYKYNYILGQRFDIPAFQQDFEFVINLPQNNNYELQSLVFSSTGYKDGDCYSLVKNNQYILNRVYTKELGQVINIRPICKIEPNDTLKYIWHNDTGTSKVIWIDFILTCQNPVNV